MTTAQDWLGMLAKGKPDLERASTAERVADVLRSRILEGDLAPGLRLSEEAIGGALGVSRNTLREAFRLLTHERLLVHEHSRGVFVRVPAVEDIRDLYIARRVIECGALRSWPRAAEQDRQALRDAVESGLASAADERWLDVGTANIRVHQAISALAGSSRINDEANRLLAELRLAFHVMGDPKRLHEIYLPMNRDIVRLLDAGEVDAAEKALVEYLDLAERHLVTQLSGS